ncbi:lytic transglycosylase domain-containing protein [Loktanella sp. SALINAS62]|uniref:lytic transglycosylase domain-containing protein n=1 Tax=Loktanella sp. SALINAS62 TaxID=2706124 RepID=UPI001B8DA2AA|nr:lytic transglycosylase domain-containing protein [Loktanella sp. SALINAS62]MBS1303005.1 lytic transglycosylase domain-containing protein [Loktanella sp. SALINAS62]
MIRLVLMLMMLASPAAAQSEQGTLCSSGKWGPVQCIRPSHFAYDTCQAIQHFAARNDLPPGFFARLLWQESRFDPNALSHADARGIAQFIDSTAQLRGLRDSLNPAQALEHSAHYLAEMTRKYGNVGLAAIGYNGGESRAQGLIDGSGFLMPETIDYVQIITGHTAQNWRDTPPPDPDFRLQGDMPFMAACLDLAQNRRFSAYPAPEPQVSPWGAQLAFGRTAAQARESYDRRTRQCGFSRGDRTLDLVFVRNRASGKQGYVMARVGADSAADATRVCTQARATGCGCAVFAN